MINKNKLAVRKLYLFSIAVVLALLFWEAIIRIGLVNPIFLPPPSSVAKALIQNYPYLLNSILITLADFAIAYIIGTSIAVITGFCFGWMRKASIAITPILLMFSTIPIVTFIPLFIMNFGLNRIPILLCGILGAFFPSFMNTMSGVKNIDKKYIEVAQNFHASDYQILKRVVLPASLPHIINGLRVSVQTTFMIIPVAEMILGDIGLGGFIWKSADLFRTDMMVLGQLTLGVLGITLYGIIYKVESTILKRWK